MGRRSRTAGKVVSRSSLTKRFTRCSSCDVISTHFDWADDAESLPISSTVATKYSHDLTCLRSSSSNPFLSLVVVTATTKIHSIIFILGLNLAVDINSRTLTIIHHPTIYHTTSHSCPLPLRWLHYIGIKTHVWLTSALHYGLLVGSVSDVLFLLLSLDFPSILSSIIS